MDCCVRAGRITLCEVSQTSLVCCYSINCEFWVEYFAWIIQKVALFLFLMLQSGNRMFGISVTIIINNLLCVEIINLFIVTSPQTTNVSMRLIFATDVLHMPSVLHKCFNTKP